MKKFIYTIAAVSVLFTGCVKDDNVPEAPVEPTSDLTVVINEVMSKDTGSNPDWVELYNTTDADIDLSGYTINDKEIIDGGSVLAEGTVIEANGYLVLTDGVEMGESISSGGEHVSLFDADGNLLSTIEVPDMSANVGLTYAAEVDGGETWTVSSPTKGASNGDVENVAPILGAADLTEFDDVYSVTASDANGIASVKLVYMVNEGVEALDMAFVDGKYRTSIPATFPGSIVKYYVIATDNTGLSTVYPENGIDTPGQYRVNNAFTEATFSETQDAVTMLYDFKVSSTVKYPDLVDEVRVYYILPGQVADDKDKIKIAGADLTFDGQFTAVIPDMAKDTDLRYYFRVEYLDGTKIYYPGEESDADGNVITDFDHDDETTWPSITVGAIPIAPINGFSDLTVTNDAGADLTFDVKVEYDNGAPQEVKFYYYINFDAVAYASDPTAYEDANRVSITWNGDLPTADNMYNFVVPGLTAGDNVSWYIRAKDGAGDKMYFTFGKDADFDKDVVEDWHVVTKN